MNQVRTNLDDLAARVQTCTSSTRPESPSEGALIYETDTDKLLAWDGSAWNPVSGAATYSASEPANPNVGSIWVDSDATSTTVNANDYILKSEAATLYPGRNRVVNGSMVVDQRWCGTSGTAVDGQFFVDRFRCFRSNATITRQRLGNDGPPGVSTHSIKLTNGTGVATPLAASAYHQISHRIEGFSVSDLEFGTVNAKPLVFSFYVKSSVTGTYSISFRNSAPDRSYVTTYTVSQANVWERKSIAITADTAGTWLIDNGTGLRIDWSLGNGSNYIAPTSNSWISGSYLDASGSIAWVATTGATFQLSGVQLESGTTVTAFEHRSFAQELAACQRYFEKSYDLSVAPGTATYLGSVQFQPSRTSTNVRVPGLVFCVRKRAKPIMSVYSVNAGSLGLIDDLSGGVTRTTTVRASDTGETRATTLDTTVATTDGNVHAFHWTADAEL